MNDNTDTQRGWLAALTVYRHPRVIGMAFLGFSAGLPFLLVFSTLSAWLRDEGVSRTAIGFFSWVGITYSIKVFWAPIVDRLPLPLLTRRLGQRRGWMLLAQLGIATGLVGMSLIDPQTSLIAVAWLALLVAFSSATQDISIDAYRIEAVQQALQAAMAATYIFGYRVALLVAGAGAFYVADFGSWTLAYQVMAACVGIGMVTTLCIAEPIRRVDRVTEILEDRMAGAMLGDRAPSRLRHATAWFAGAVVGPFVDFFRRNGWVALTILLLVAIYRVSDITMGVMANPFYLDLGFSKSEIASVTKVFGFFMTIAGSFIGGVLVARYGLGGPLVAGAALVAATNLLFALLAGIGPDLQWLTLVISADNLAGGLSNVVFIAWLSSLTSQAYTATQYALFSSLMTLPGKVVGGFSGIVVDASGYAPFFLYAAAIGLPAILLSIYMWWRSRRLPPSEPVTS